MKKLAYVMVVLFAEFLTFGQPPVRANVAEVEPNNPCGTGISTNLITHNETYTGSVTALTDYDCWYFNAGSSGSVTLNVQATLSAQLVLYECSTDYCTGCTAVRTINTGGSNSYTLNASKFYRFEIAQFGGGPGTGTYGVGISGDATLPVSLASFSARIKGKSVVIEWITESETENLGFILERSEDAKSWNEAASYRTNDALVGRGNSSSRSSYSFLDENVLSGRTYFYRLSDVNTQGVVTSHAPISITLSETPESLVLERAFPNPFNPNAFISYRLPDDAHVNVSVYDFMGRTVKRLFDGWQAAGTCHTYWNGTDEKGRRASSGIYLIRVQTGTDVQVQKIMLMK